VLQYLYIVYCAGYIGNTGRVTEARLGRELSEKKIIDFTLRESGFDIIKLSSITKPPSKVWCVCVCVCVQCAE